MHLYLFMWYHGCVAEHTFVLGRFTLHFSLIYCHVTLKQHPSKICSGSFKLLLFFLTIQVRRVELGSGI